MRERAFVVVLGLALDDQLAGLGLGLLLVDHGGRLRETGDRDGGGLAVTLFLPQGLMGLAKRFKK